MDWMSCTVSNNQNHRLAFQNGTGIHNEAWISKLTSYSVKALTVLGDPSVQGLQYHMHVKNTNHNPRSQVDNRMAVNNQWY